MTAPPDPFADALMAARLCAIDPRLGGMSLRGGGDARDLVVATLLAGLPDGAPSRRLPVHADDDALFGGLDVGATLASGTKVSRRGMIAEAAGGVVLAPMAERMSDALAARIASAMDDGGVILVALDDGIEPDERPPAALVERLAFWLDLTRSSPARGGGPFAPSANGGGAGATLESFAIRSIQREPLPFRGGRGELVRSETALMPGDPSTSFAGPPPRAGEECLHALAALTLALGIDSARAPLFALRAARASASLAGRAEIADEDVTLAVRLVLAPRATRMPAEAEAEAEAPPPPPPENDDAGEEERGMPDALDDVVLAAALAALPADLLARIAAGGTRGRTASRARGAGERRRSPTHGRPLGARAGKPGGGRPLSLIDTLRAAAPWQRLRDGEPGRIRIRRDDLRIRRFETRAEALTIFAVDASGSAALARLAEAKGAVELLLAQAYVKRAQVALLAFRGIAAELLLPPTRSLTRARRSLADLPGGGGTPLAAGLEAARALAESARQHGRTPFLVVLTDGRANVAADGGTNRDAAQRDAETAARAIGLAGIAAAFVDTSVRPRPEGAKLAAAMRARYLPLPRADAATMHAAVVAAQPA